MRHLAPRLARATRGGLPVAVLVLVTAVVAAVALLLPGRSVASPATTTDVVRPVTADGHAAAGWTTHRERGRVDCDGASPAAVDPGIAGCYPAAYALRGCWAARHRTVLCLRDLGADGTTRDLVRLRRHGSFPRAVAAPAEPAPVALVLADGQRCLLRVGGAWGAPGSHPSWIGHYSCTDDSVYAPARSTTGIDQSRPVWRVRLWDGASDSITRARVVSATFLGTAPAA